MAKQQQMQKRGNEMKMEVKKKEKCQCEHCHCGCQEANWQGTAALVLAVISIYFLWLPVVNLILAVAALVLGLMGVQAREKTSSVIAIVVGILNTAVSLLMVIGCLTILNWLHEDTDVWEDEWTVPDYGWQQEMMMPRQQMMMPEMRRGGVDMSVNRERLDSGVMRSTGRREMNTDDGTWQMMPMQLPVEWK